jgi:hypothetical protein
MNVEMHRGGWFVASPMLVEKRANAFACTIFLSQKYHPSEHGAWVGAIELTQIEPCRITTVMGSKQLKVVVSLGLRGELWTVFGFGLA